MKIKAVWKRYLEITWGCDKKPGSACVSVERVGAPWPTDIPIAAASRNLFNDEREDKTNIRHKYCLLQKQLW